MVTTTFAGSVNAELLQPFAHRTGLLQPLAVPAQHQHQHQNQHARRVGLETTVGVGAQKRSPLLCGYPSKKCWSWRVEKRNGELHKFCEYHRQKANTNQRRMEQRRKLGRSAGPRGAKGGSSPRRASSKVPSAAQPEAVVKVERVSRSGLPCPSKKGAAKTTPSGSPRGIDGLESGCLGVHYAMDATSRYSWNDVEVDIGISVDAAVEYMMVDSATIEMEPSDKPVDLYEEDLFFLEHFIAEISHSAV